MPAAVRTIASITRRRMGPRPRLWASDSPRPAVSGAPIASAKAAAEEMRSSGSSSSPAASASRSSGSIPGASFSSLGASP